VIDTDMSIDVDDVGALCAAHALADLGEASILAVVHDTGFELGVGAVSAINHHFGRDDIPVGAYRGPVGPTPLPEKFMREGKGVYVEELVNRFDPPIRDASQAPDALQVYRSALAAAEDGTVVVASIGHATNLVPLLQSPGDEISTLTGSELVARKVKKMVVMGGFRGDPSVYTDPTYQPEYAEWNFGGCGGPWVAPPPPPSSEDNHDDDTDNSNDDAEESQDNSDESHDDSDESYDDSNEPRDCGGYDLLGNITHTALALWPSSVPIVFLGFRTGERVFTGAENVERDLDDSPCDVAYRKFCGELEGYCNGGEGRNSWDPMAVLFAVRGDAHGYYRETRGMIRIDTPSGMSRWTPSPGACSGMLPALSKRP